MTPTQRAAEFLRHEAGILFECNTVDGDWRFALECKSEHDELIALAAELEAMPQQEGLRERAALASLQGMIARGDDELMRGHEGWREELCREAIRYADTMTAELARTEPQS